MPDVDLKIPGLGESIAEATIAKWLKKDGEFVRTDDEVVELETDKATVPVVAGNSGTLKIIAQAGANVRVGDVVAKIDPAGKPAAGGAKPAAAPAKAEAPAAAGSRMLDLKAVGLDDLSPAVRAAVVENKLQNATIPATGPGGRLTKEDVQNYLKEQGEGGEADATAAAVSARQQMPDGFLSTLGTSNVPNRAAHEATGSGGATAPSRPLAPGEEREEMSKLRQTIARRLVEAQHATASLTTFNEVDLSAVMALR